MAIEIYMQGVTELLQRLGVANPEYINVLTLQTRLARINESEKLYGITADTRAEFSQIAEELNRICIDTINQTFNDLCGIHNNSTTIRTNDVSTPIEKRFFSGAILYIVVTDFPSLSNKNQIAALSFIETEVESFLKIVGATYWVNSRGGDCILFVERNYDEHKTISITKMFLLALKLQIDTYNQPYKISAVLHWEDNAVWRQLINTQYLIGPAISEAVRTIPFSQTNHFILSSRSYDLLRDLLSCGSFISIGSLFNSIRETFSTSVPYMSIFEPTFIKNLSYRCEEISTYDQYRNSYSIFNFYIVDQDNYTFTGDSSIPREKVLIDYRQQRQDHFDQILFERLVDADEFYMIDMTHEFTATILESALATRKKMGRGFWQNVRIIFPSQSILEHISDRAEFNKEILHNWIIGKKSISAFLLSQGSEFYDNWECQEYLENLPFIGAQFLSTKGSSIRIALILPIYGQDKTFYLEFFKGTSAYEQLSLTFGAIQSIATKLSDWIIYGVTDVDKFYYHGLVNRTRLNNRKNSCRAVVLVLLYAEADSGMCAWLQERTIYNSYDKFGYFSNVTGLLLEADVSTYRGWPPMKASHDMSDLIATKEFNKKFGLEKGNELPIDVWLAAGIREVQEDTGLELPTDRFHYHRHYHLVTEGVNLYFQIFSLKLRVDNELDELQLILHSKPYANLSPFNFERLNLYHQQGKLNRLLQNKYEEVFVPIYQELGIDD